MSRPRVAVVHNEYLFAGGEDAVVRNESQLLRDHGHAVLLYTRSNADLVGRNALRTAAETVWNGREAARLTSELRRFRPDVVHFHNTFPLLSPAVYRAARSVGAAVVQTLHNYRLVCPRATLFRDGQPCEDCLTQLLPRSAILHACYRHDRKASAVTSAMLFAHRLSGTFTHFVDRYVAPSRLTKEKVGGRWVPEHLIDVKPHFIAGDSDLGEGTGGYVAYVGRLSQEKGLGTLLDAWERAATPWRLKIVGDGPLEDVIRRRAAGLVGVEVLGRLGREDVMGVLRQAVLMVFPSITYETFGLAALESMSFGTPVVASGHGAAVELIEEGETGWTFPPGDAAALAEVLERLASSQGRLAAMRPSVRERAITRFGKEQNYALLSSIYEAAIRSRQARTA